MCTPLPVLTLPGHHVTRALRDSRALVRMKPNDSRNETSTEQRRPARRVGREVEVEVDAGVERIHARGKGYDLMPGRDQRAPRRRGRLGHELRHRVHVPADVLADRVLLTAGTAAVDHVRQPAAEVEDREHDLAVHGVGEPDLGDAVGPAAARPEPEDAAGLRHVAGVLGGARADRRVRGLVVGLAVDQLGDEERGHVLGGPGQGHAIPRRRESCSSARDSSCGSSCTASSAMRSSWRLVWR